MKSDFFIYYSFVCSVFARLIQTSPGGSLKYNSNPESESDLYREICVWAGCSGHSYLISKCLLSVLHCDIHNIILK